MASGDHEQTTEELLADLETGERHIEMTWCCSTCKHQNLGRFKRCQGCGKPLEHEPFEMPAGTASAATVTDAALLRMATAGPDWRCAYCGSEQRATDGSCGQCGASPIPAAPASAVAAPDRPTRPWWFRYAVAGGIVAFLALASLPLIVWNQNRPRQYDGTVTAVAWEQVIDVEHYANHDHEGFKEAIPASATDITSLGQRVHHQEQVLDHTETEHYTEEVPDGYRTESYTEQVACGEDCSTSSPICHEECKSSNNGFASCHQVCSGGGRECSPKMCTENHSREVPKTRTEYRTREVPIYRSEPRYAEAFHYKAWDWKPDRTVRAAGTEATGLHWPDNGERTTGLPDGELERETRHGTYTVTLRYHGRIVNFAVKTAADFAAFPTHSTHEVKYLHDALFVDHSPITAL